MAVRIRILEVLASLRPAGAENVVLSLASGRDPSRFDTGVVSLYDAFPGGLEPLLEARRVRVWHLGKRRGPDPRMYASLRRLMREFQPDVIHSHCYVTRYTLHLRARAMVHTVHNLASRELGPLARLVQRYAFRRGVAPVAVGATVADSFQQMYGFPPAATIPNGIDTDRFWRPEGRKAWRRANGFGEDDLLVVSTARLVPQKNPVALADAIANVPNAHLLIAGEGCLRGSLEGRERVHLLGVRDDVPDLLAAGDIFALASHWEGFPLAIIEAMAAGLPVVATRVGGVPEIVEHGRTGLIVSPQNKRDLADALRTLTNDPNRRRDMGAAGRARSLCFSVNTMVAAYADLFARLLCAQATDHPSLHGEVHPV
jgi:glycosyltransferase involved in cell wall biosynthesis